MAAIGQGTDSSPGQRNLIDAQPEELLARVSTFLSVQDTTCLASASRARLEAFPGSIGHQTNELVYRFFLESRASSERALLRAANRGAILRAYALIRRRPDMSAPIVIRALRKAALLMDDPPHCRLFFGAPHCNSKESAISFIDPLLRLPITADWLGETLIATAGTPDMNLEAKAMAIDLLLEKQSISNMDVGRAVVILAELPFDPRNEDILMNFLAKRPNMNSFYKHPTIICAAQRGYRRLLAALLETAPDYGVIALLHAAHFGHQGIVTDLLGARWRFQFTEADLTEAFMDAAKNEHGDIARTLLAATANRSEVVRNAIFRAIHFGSSPDLDLARLLETYL